MDKNFPIALSLGGKSIAVTGRNVPAAPKTINQTLLRGKIVDAFSSEDMELLCADIEQKLKDTGITLKVSWDDIGGGSSRKENKVLKLIDYLDRRGHLEFLVTAIKQKRENLI